LTLLDNPSFSWLSSATIQALWVVFSLLVGTVGAGLSYAALAWTIQIFTWIEV